jgi:hypothetical protein
MFCNQHRLNHSDNKFWAEMFQTSLCQSLVLFWLANHKFCDECHRHLSSSWLWSQFYKNLITFFFLISSYVNDFYHQHQSSLEWLFPITFDVWFAFLPLKSLSSESRDEILFRGEAVTVHVFVTLCKYFVSVKYVFVCIKLMCVVWSFWKFKVQVKRVFL